MHMSFQDSTASFDLVLAGRAHKSQFEIELKLTINWGQVPVQLQPLDIITVLYSLPFYSLPFFKIKVTRSIVRVVIFCEIYDMCRVDRSLGVRLVKLQRESSH